VVIRKERLLLSVCMVCLLAGLVLKRFGGESWIVLALRLAITGTFFFFIIRIMLKLRAGRLRAEGDNGDG
jgi:hypothetical protein